MGLPRGSACDPTHVFCGGQVVEEIAGGNWRDGGDIAVGRHQFVALLDEGAAIVFDQRDLRAVAGGAFGSQGHAGAIALAAEVDAALHIAV